MANFVWAIDENGKPTKCTAKPENRGKRNCKHKFHNDDNLPPKEFFSKHSVKIDNKNKDLDASQSEIDKWATQLDKIAGEKVTEDNFQEVISRMSVSQLDQINKLGFEAAPAFSIPITDDYTDALVSNNIAFAELPEYGVSKAVAMNDMFGVIGDVPTTHGNVNIDTNYRDGLNEDQYFDKHFTTRGSNVQKSIGVRDPGAVSRITWYGMSDLVVVDDCGGDHKNGVICCSAPGVCKKCASKSGWKVKEGQMAGSIISTNLTEGLTQASLSSIHTGGRGESKQEWQIISSTLKGEASSPIIKAANEAKTTMEKRQILADGLAAQYEKAGIEVDRYNIDMVAKKMTSYKLDKNNRLEYIKDTDEECGIFSMKKIGGKNNLFLQAQLGNGSNFNRFSKPGTYEVDTENSVFKIMQ